MEPKYVAIRFPFSTTFLDFPDPISTSLLIYLTGCEHDCSDCQNKNFQIIDPNNNEIVMLHTNTLIRTIDHYLKKEKNVDSIVLSGGDPCFENNMYFTKKFCIEYGEKIPIAIYTGYDIDFIKQNGIVGFRYIKCGKFDTKLKQEPFKNDYEMQLASSNQEWYDSNYKQVSEKGILKFY